MAEETGISRQAKYGQQRVAEGKCRDCGAMREVDAEGVPYSKSRCFKCLHNKAKQKRKKLGYAAHKKGSRGRKPLKKIAR